MFTTVTDQLKAKAVTIKSGTLVDASIIMSATINDGGAGPDELPDDPVQVFADSTCRVSHFRNAVRVAQKAG